MKNFYTLENRRRLEKLTYRAMLRLTKRWWPGWPLKRRQRIARSLTVEAFE
jgi:hypothetical protein